MATHLYSLFLSPNYFGRNCCSETDLVVLFVLVVCPCLPSVCEADGGGGDDGGAVAEAGVGAGGGDGGGVQRHNGASNVLESSGTGGEGIGKGIGLDDDGGSGITDPAIDATGSGDSRG